MTDEFGADNDFWGGQLGLRYETKWKRFHFTLGSKVALGAVRESVVIRGRTTIDDGTPETFDAGLLALATNTGRHSRSVFAVVPEIAATVGIALTEKCSFSAGYSWLYCSDVVRPSEQIDRNLNPNLIPTSATFGDPGGPDRPAFRFRGSDWHAQGLHVGLEFKY